MDCRRMFSFNSSLKNDNSASWTVGLMDRVEAVCKFWKRSFNSFTTAILSVEHLHFCINDVHSWPFSTSARVTFRPPARRFAISLPAKGIWYSSIFIATSLTALIV